MFISIRGAIWRQACMAAAHRLLARLQHLSLQTCRNLFFVHGLTRLSSQGKPQRSPKTLVYQRLLQTNPSSQTAGVGADDAGDGAGRPATSPDPGQPKGSGEVIFCKLHELMSAIQALKFYSLCSGFSIPTVCCMLPRRLQDMVQRAHHWHRPRG